MKSLFSSSSFDEKSRLKDAQPANSGNQKAAIQDNRPEAVSQRKMDQFIQNSPLTLAQAKYKNAAFGAAVQKMDGLDEEELMQGKMIQKMGGPEEEELMQGKMVSQAKSSTVPVQRSANKTGMPDNVKSQMESSFQTDFSDVKIHANSPQAPKIGALAYTQGSDVHFAPGQFKPDSTSGQQLLGHELTHVVQQREGIVKPTTQAMGMPVNDDVKFESEADAMGKKAAQTKIDKED